MISRQSVADALTRFDRLEETNTELTRAAVTLFITRTTEHAGLGILLTRRAATLRRHAGQYALPGGRVDPGESIVQAALRECEEEIGLKASTNDIVGTLDDFVTQSGFCITPVVVFSENRVTPVPDPTEVEQVFNIPLPELESASAHRLNLISRVQRKMDFRFCCQPSVIKYTRPPPLFCFSSVKSFSSTDRLE